MASALTKVRVDGVSIYKCQLTVSATGTENGEWINIEGLGPFSIHLSGVVSGDIIQIRGSNDATRPSNATHDIQLGSNITVDGITEYTVPIRWIKSRVSAWAGGGTLIVELVVRNK